MEKIVSPFFFHFIATSLSWQHLMVCTSYGLELSPRHLQNIKSSRIQAGDPQIRSFSTADLQAIFPSACIMLYIVYK